MSWNIECSNPNSDSIFLDVRCEERVSVDHGFASVKFRMVRNVGDEDLRGEKAAAFAVAVSHEAGLDIPELKNAICSFVSSERKRLHK